VLTVAGVEVQFARMMRDIGPLHQPSAGVG
jgi:hypothetical protein